MHTFLFATKAGAVEVESLEIRALDNLKLNSSDSEQLEATIRKIAIVLWLSFHLLRRQTALGQSCGRSASPRAVPPQLCPR